MALSSTDLDKLDTAIAQGALTLEFNGRRITYRSMDELMAARAHVAAQLAAAAATRKAATKRYTFTTLRGD
jgi:hypothetical protein